jgi:uncharacterized protein (TIGR00661 family)
MILKAFSEDGFIADLAGCKGVVTNGGFSLISEALYLKKPVCAVPLGNQFEQFVNAASIEKCRYGRMFPVLIPDYLRSFLYQIKEFRKSVRVYHQDGNRRLFSELDKVLSQVQESGIRSQVSASV